MTQRDVVLRIFSYLPNPRIWKSTIAARIAGLEVDVQGAPAGELGGWLWDFEPRPLTETDRQNPLFSVEGRTGFKSTLYKTPAFREAQPWGTVPAAFSPDGRVGVFESNSIMRAVARQADPAHGLYGTDPYTASRIDGFLDVALVFARDSQIYLLSFGDKSLNADIHRAAGRAFDNWIGGIEHALTNAQWLCGDTLSIADICFACEVTLFSRERAALFQLDRVGAGPVMGEWEKRFPHAHRHYEKLCRHEAFVPDMQDYLIKLENDVTRARQRLAGEDN